MWTIALSLLLTAQTDTQPRPRHPIAPSLPLLTKEEDARYEKMIDRFIEADIGAVTGAAAAKAMAELNKVPPEAIFLLIDAFNRAANLEASCPAVLLGKRISMILNGSNDIELLTFAKENIGAGVTGKRHMVTVRDLQVGCALRRSAIVRQQQFAAKAPPATMPFTGFGQMPLPEMTKAAERAKAPQFKMMVAEAEKRKTPELLKLLAAGAANPDGETRKLGQSLLQKQLERETPERLKMLLKDDSAEVRAAAARVIGLRDLRFGAELIERLSDVEPAVQQAARQALVRLARGTDFGPEASADSTARESAIERWRLWWSKQ